MFWQIVLHTPQWVWLLLVGLIVLGLVQVRDRDLPGPVILALPLVMVAYSAYGLFATFGADARALVPWCVGVAVTIVLNQTVFGIPRNVARDPGVWRFRVHGSLLPLVLILAIFCTRYALGVLTHMSPASMTGTGFIIGVAFWLGLCGGFFPARAIRILGAPAAA